MATAVGGSVGCGAVVGTMMGEVGRTVGAGVRVIVGITAVILPRTTASKVALGVG